MQNITSKKKIVLIVIVFILLIIGILFFMQRKNNNHQIIQQLGEKVTAENLSSLIKEGKSFQCTGTVKDPNFQLTSIFYLSQDKYSQENDLTLSSGKSSISYLVRDGSYSYSWGTDVNFGNKNKIEPNPNITTAESLINKMLFGAETIPGATCNTWQVDASKFIPPSTIKWQGNYNPQTDTYNPIPQ